MDSIMLGMGYAALILANGHFKIGHLIQLNGGTVRKTVLSIGG